MNRVNNKRYDCTEYKSDYDVQCLLFFKQIDDLEIIDPGKGNKEADKYYEK
jgi:hypothetical protein